VICITLIARHINRSMDEAQSGFGPKVSASMAEWSARLTRRRLNMNVQETTGIRELTAQELDQVNGGVILEAYVITMAAVVLSGSLGGLWEWLFGD
jgi:lactobin A/cerein 7B family class IIb bacteriocin